MFRYSILFLLVAIQSTVVCAQPYRDGPDSNTRVMYEHFDVLFHHYETHNTMQEEDEPWMTALNKTITADTIVLQEYDHYLVSDSVKLHIKPKNDDDRFKLYYSLKHNLAEQYDYRVHGEFKEWSKDRVTWSGYNSPIQLTWSEGYYYMPSVNYPKEESWIKKHLSLRDTLVDVPSEGGNVATVVYKERPALHGTEEALLKIERYNGGKLLETKYIRILLMVGC